MSPDGTCRLLVEPAPHSGAWNMAVDEVLLESALHDGICSLRFYRWEQATVSLGYFQSADEAVAIPAFAGLPCVRRLSGGGAILHHHELTYSCAIPATHPLSQTPGRLYELIHRSLIDVLARQGVAATLRGDVSASSESPFLCFGRGDARDVVCHGQKMLGSAQRRRKGAVLQHGSILLKRSEHAPEFAGLLDLCPNVTFDSETSIAREMAEQAAGMLAAHTQEAALSPDEQARAVLLRDEKYRRLDWKQSSPLKATGGC